MRAEVTNEAVKATPPVMVSVAGWFGGLTINQAVGIATIVYIALQAGYLVWKWHREYKAK